MNARVIENGKISGSENSCNVEIQEIKAKVTLTWISNEIVVPQIVEPINNHEEQVNGPITHNKFIIDEPRVNGPQ